MWQRGYKVDLCTGRVVAGALCLLLLSRCVCEKRWLTLEELITLEYDGAPATCLANDMGEKTSLAAIARNFTE